MGPSQSKKKIQDLEKKQEEMMKEHADMVKRLADEHEAHRKEQEAALEKMAQMMLLVVAAQHQQSDKGEKQKIEIEGVVYSVTDQLGKGGFGEVYKAERVDGRGEVAIKVMENSPMIQQQIENEIRFLRLTRKVSLNPHPVIEYYGCKTTPRQILIAMELAECDLFSFWFRGMAHRSGEEQFIWGLIIMMYTLRALTFLERLNIVHGDIKPHNLVIVGQENSIAVKLIDFGTIEKMNTHRSAMTVEADKPYTQFFVSPEFLRRDSRNMIARRLHKKSDAWAAGVMFYLLFLGKLPWEDEHDYHNFINNSRAADVVVPVTGGYKLIIELLLKKDPDERASAKDTLLQMKAHPELGKVVSMLEDKFYPADDVCHVRIPDSVRDEMENFVSPRQRAHMVTDTSSSTRRAGGQRRSCRYGRECYRKNAEHREEFAHPGDSDYSSSQAAAKPVCQYGSQCYRKNREHLDKYSHS